MMIYPIIVYGSPILRNENKNIDKDYPEIVKLTEDMFETMYAAEGVGLAAPQIGKNIRVFVVDITPWADDEPELKGFRKAFINPEIYWRSDDEELFNEGCLSIPGINEEVSRPSTIRMRYLDENFVAHDEEFTARAARVIQHEYDHLEGILYTDRLSPLRRTLLKSKLTGMSKGKYRADYRTK
jgi:peptide deformylase